MFKRRICWFVHSSDWSYSNFCDRETAPLLQYSCYKGQRKGVINIPVPRNEIFKKTSSIKTSQINRVEFEDDAPLIGFTRKILILNLKNENHIKLISTDYSATAAELTNFRNQLLRQL